MVAQIAFTAAALVVSLAAMARKSRGETGSSEEWRGRQGASAIDADFFGRPRGQFAATDMLPRQRDGGVILILERSNKALVDAIRFAETALVPPQPLHNPSEMESAMAGMLLEINWSESNQRIGRARSRQHVTGGRPGYPRTRDGTQSLARRARVLESKAPMILGVVAVCRGGFYLLCDVKQESETERLGPGVSRRLFAADVAVSTACLTALYAGGALDTGDVVGAVASIAAGWAVAGGALFGFRDPLGPDPPPEEFLARRALAAAGIVVSWGAWVQAA